MATLGTCFLLLLGFVAISHSLEDTVVKTKQGTVEGFEDTSVNGRQFLTFLGIPFAKPPVRELRFMDPEFPEPWEGIRDASEMPPYCLQRSIILEMIGKEPYVGSEDCLYLNVYAPKLKPKNPLPVMVYIHGGGFYCGGAQEYTGHSFMDRDVVLVVLQYRVGIFGFYSLNDAKFMGNYGLKDQSMALKWVQENINYFDGDPNSVTLFGESAGGASVQYQLMTSWSKDLFHRAIQQSSSALSPYAFNFEVNAKSTELANAMGCSLESGVEAFRNCMKFTDGSELLKESVDEEANGLPGDYVPTVDGDFLVDEPAVLLKSGRYANIDLMFGVTQDEGGDFLVWDDKWSEIYNDRIKALYFYKEKNGLELLKMVEDKYFGDKGFSRKPSWEAKALLEDCIVIYSQQVTADFFSRNRNVDAYFYEFKFKPEYNALDPKNLLPDNVVAHGAELVFLFAGGGLFNRTLKDEQNIKVQEIMLDLWTNFAATGDPTPSDSTGVNWEPVYNGELKYLEIKPFLEMKLNFRKKTLNFWKSLPLHQNTILYPKYDEL